MIKVTLITNAGRKSFPVSDDATPRKVFDDNNVNYSVGKPAIDSVPMGIGDMDKSFAELGITDSCYLTCVVKADNAATAKVAGSACVITSALKRKDLELVAKYRPEELCLYEGEGKDKEAVFGVCLTESSAGTLNKYGAEFGPATSQEGLATITLLIDPDEENVASMLEDKIGPGLLKLDEIEAKIPAVLDAIKADQAKVREHITLE